MLNNFHIAVCLPEKNLQKDVFSNFILTFRLVFMGSLETEQTSV